MAGHGERTIHRKTSVRWELSALTTEPFIQLVWNKCIYITWINICMNTRNTHMNSNIINTVHEMNKYRVSCFNPIVDLKCWEETTSYSNPSKCLSYSNKICIHRSRNSNKKNCVLDGLKKETPYPWSRIYVTTVFKLFTRRWSSSTPYR